MIRILSVAALLVAVFFFASPARAAIVHFDIDETQSFQTWTETFDATEIGAGVSVTTAQFPGSDSTSLDGWLFADVVSGSSLTLGALPGHDNIVYGIGAPGVGGTPGLYVPEDPITSAPPFPAVGTQPGSNYGLATGGPLSIIEAVWGLRGTIISGAPRLLSGGPLQTFDLIPGLDVIIGLEGRIATSSALSPLSASDDVFLLAAFATGGISKGSFDPVTGELTIPIESSFTVAIDSGRIVPGTSIYRHFSHFGVIVAYPVVPEPSTLALAAFGFVALATWGWRRRA